MEKDEEDQEQRYCCKYCGKICTSGKSLGGHMRLHLALIAANKNEESMIKTKKKKKKIAGMGFDDDDRRSSQSDDEEKMKTGEMGSYGLRENPRKSWRVSDPKRRAPAQQGGSSRTSVGEENVCEKCGKGFDSIKALFGHLKIHSKRSGSSDESGETPETENVLPPIRKKRSRTRYRDLHNRSSSSSSNLTDFSSSSTDMDEVEEAARCLILLSQGANQEHYPLFESEFAVSGSTPIGNKKSQVSGDESIGFDSMNLNKKSSSIKSRDHGCPLCLKNFSSGQALGGHMRAHYTGLSENRGGHDEEDDDDDDDAVFDLNLEISVDDGEDGGFVEG